MAEHAGVPDPKRVASPTSVNPTNVELAGPQPTAQNKFGKLRGMRGPRAPYIATPAPASLNRSVPAGDIDEQTFSRTWWYGKADAEAAETAKLRILNIWEREREELEKNLVEERARLQIVMRLRRESQNAREVAGKLNEEAKTAEENEAIKLRDNAILALKTAHKLETRATQAEARRVHHQAAIVISLFWVDFHQRAQTRGDLVGEWRTEEDQVEWAKVKFDKLFGAPELPKKKAIKKLIAKTRNGSDLTRFNTSKADAAAVVEEMA
jgi:hypothetical protein